MWTVNELPRMRSQEDIDFMRKNYKVPSKYTNFMDKSDINQIVDFWQENIQTLKTLIKNHEKSQKETS